MSSTDFTRTASSCVGRHGDRVFVQIAVGADLVPLIDDLLHLVREGFDGMAGNEEGGLEFVFLEQAQEAEDADLAREDAALNVGRRIAAAVGAYPARDEIDVRAERADDFFFRHASFSHRKRAGSSGHDKLPRHSNAEQLEFHKPRRAPRLDESAAEAGSWPQSGGTAPFLSTIRR